MYYNSSFCNVALVLLFYDRSKQKFSQNFLWKKKSKTVMLPRSILHFAVSFFFSFMISWIERVTRRQKKKMVRERLTFYPLFIPQMPTIARAEPDPNQKPRTLSRPHLQQQFKSLSHHLLLSRKHISKKNCSQVLTQSTPVWDTDIWSGSFIYCATMCASIY